ncbi:TetR/AcrR family transcriptional regulator [Streptomyces cylindrosporus]|uniref:TetR/AcrR family transcriptional regulator n=1 Tax=Streptomyces cylindrosporus TaxID=2927583 RepID=A0ABS9Y022_9ACTN|nr:TetR/AcrR family transcriptional regulator [Streptomyces cylindrosporus]MCI3270563.1 TetR/AcrR family transcriptional regulator [Streptomyces cylindrosporus]
MSESTRGTGTGTRRVRLTPAERRESILAAATEVFAETGYQRTKVSAIAARVGVSEPVVFQNFGTKAALYEAVLDRGVAHVCAALTEAVEGGRPVTELLAGFLEPGHMARFHSRGSLGFLFADAFTLQGEPELREAVRAAHQRFADTFAELVREGQQTGAVRRDLDPQAAAWWLLSLLHARTFRAAFMPEQQVLEGQLVAMTLDTLTGS